MIKKWTSIYLFCIGISIITAQSRVSIRVYDTALFYDGYSRLDTLIQRGEISPIPPSGYTRLSTSLYTTELKADQIKLIGDSLWAHITVKAACDNYDRIAYLALAMVPKSRTKYSANDTDVVRIELARWITPFMNRNKHPDTVAYHFDLHHIALILRNSQLTHQYNFWVELSIFGVPYAAQKQVAGCQGRHDVFYGSVDLVTNITNKPLSSSFTLIPISHQFYLNNYQPQASDSVGLSQKTFDYYIPHTFTDMTIYLISSNHGAGENGEEYNRRKHLVYLDQILIDSFVPGEPSCEPYRHHNTQGNGIYTKNILTPAEWQSFSNWCPGAKIPIRAIPVGKLSKGKHQIKLSIPDAVFYNRDGYFPISMYLIGRTKSSYHTPKTKTKKVKK